MNLRPKNIRPIFVTALDVDHAVVDVDYAPATKQSLAFQLDCL